MAGIVITGTNIQSEIGDIARQITSQMRRAIAIKRFLDRFSAPDLVTQFALSSGDANLLKSVTTEFATIDTTFQANRSFIDQVAGLGDV